MRVTSIGFSGRRIRKRCTDVSFGLQRCNYRILVTLRKNLDDGKRTITLFKNQTSAKA